MMSNHHPDRPDTDTVTVRHIPPTVREVATVTVQQPVDGTKKRKTRSDKGKPRGPRRPILDTLTLDDLEPEIRAAAEATRLPGQVFRVVSPTEVWIENR